MIRCVPSRVLHLIADKQLGSDEVMTLASSCRTLHQLLLRDTDLWIALLVRDFGGTIWYKQSGPRIGESLVLWRARYKNSFLELQTALKFATNGARGASLFEQPEMLDFLEKTQICQLRRLVELPAALVNDTQAIEEISSCSAMVTKAANTIRGSRLLAMTTFILSMQWSCNQLSKMAGMLALNAVLIFICGSNHLPAGENWWVLPSWDHISASSSFISVLFGATLCGVLCSFSMRSLNVRSLTEHPKVLTSGCATYACSFS